MSPQSLLSTGEGSGLRGGEHLLKRARPYEGESPFEERGAPLWRKGHVHFDLVAEKGVPLLQRAHPFGKRALPECYIET